MFANADLTSIKAWNTSAVVPGMYSELEPKGAQQTSLENTH
jgi:hypothetical protein